MIFKRLSDKVLINFLIISLLILLSNYFVFKKITKKTFYESEKEKAEIIAKTITPLIGINMFLGLDDRVKELLNELLKNKNILSVSITKNSKTLMKKSKSFLDKKNSFFVTQPIFKPNSTKKIATLHIVYSNKSYKKLVKKYQKILLISLSGLLIIIIILGIYINYLLKPLKNIAKRLKKFNPKNSIQLTYIDKEDEIGDISRALMSMQKKVRDYSSRLENINKFLEEKVDEKTRELKEQLYIDSLTKLPNRFSLQETVKESKKKNKKISLLIIDIDDFKHINDLFGNEIGDKILKNFSIRLKYLLKKYKSATIYRLSGDEFVIVFNKKMSRSDMSQFINLLIKSIEKMVFLHHDNELNIRVTIGGIVDSSYPLEKADIALKFAKKEKKAYKIYDEKLKLEKEYKKNMEWVEKIKKAIENDKIIPYFQPVCYSNNLKIKSYESLMRLIDEEGNAISPFFFIEIAKKSRYYPDLTKIMFKKCCEYFKNRSCKFSFNLSIIDIFDENIMSYIKNMAKEYKIENRIIFEILESEGIENFEEVLKFINDVHKIGAKIAIDDFGSGYSNFEYLVKLDIDYLKIDGSLIKNINKDENSKIVVGVIVDYAKKKGIKTVAEFVSNKEIHETVKELGIDFVQGYFISEPLPTAKC